MPQHSGAQTPGGAAAAAAAAAQQQQMYPANMPYYPYYYMPNQFGYQQSYGQPFLNKNMYPNMYQQHSVKPSTGGSAASPYGSASPYSQNMYGQSVTGNTGGYDDMSGLQQHLGGMSLHDYQKPYQQQQQLPGFLGASGQQQPNQPQQAQQQQTPQQSNKNEVTGVKQNAAANGHQQPPQQQQYQQMNPANYLGHSFPYQQQYPQQHFPHFQQQQQPTGQQQQAPSAQQPSPMGRQQPYWSQ